MRNKLHNVDETEFLNILECNMGAIVKIARAYTDTMHDREDLVNDIIYELWRSAGSFKGNSGISTWIYRVALNTSMTRLRKKKKEPRWNSADTHSQIADTSWSPLDDDTDTALMYKCIDEMEGINKAIILLYLDDKSHDEIAEIMGMSKTNVGTRIGRIKDFLRKKCNP